MGAAGRRPSSTGSGTVPRRRSATGIAPERAALARGFVLGQDDAIDPRSPASASGDAGLSHLLAVSGQNVMLLAILAGVAPRASAACRCAPASSLIALSIAAYVPIAGAGPSIQRAGSDGGRGDRRDALEPAGRSAPG